MKRAYSRLMIVSAAAGAILVASAGTAAAVPSVSATPGNMPTVTSADSYVRKIAQCGSTMYAVGTFTTVGTTTGGHLTRNNAFSFDANTGAVSSWNPNTNGTVDTVAFSADCSAIYLGGNFTTVNGVARSHLAKVAASNAAVDPAFNPAPNGEVYTLQQAHGHLIVGGSYTTIGGVSRRALSSLNLTTGAVDSYVTLAVAGNLPNSRQKIYNFRLSNSGDKLLAMGSFTSIAGTARQQMFMMDLGTSSTTLDTWYVPAFSLACASVEPFYVQAAAWSPDDTHIYIATTGYRNQSPLCDAAAAFLSTSLPTQTALWINYPGCDSLYAVAADASFVYVGGHERWMSNNACDSKGSTALDRPGVGSMNASNGTATSWNPTRDRGKGADDMTITSQGLWVASDTYNNSVLCGHAYHPGICFFPHG